MKYEDSIDREIWMFVNEKKERRKEVLQLVLPEELYLIYTKYEETIKVHISYLLADRINEIIQSNLFFLIENNQPDLRAIEDLFKSVIHHLRSKTGHAKLSEITVIYINMKGPLLLPVESRDHCSRYYPLPTAMVDVCNLLHMDPTRVSHPA